MTNNERAKIEALANDLEAAVNVIPEVGIDREKYFQGWLMMAVQTLRSLLESVTDCNQLEKCEHEYTQSLKRAINKNNEPPSEFPLDDVYTDELLDKNNIDWDARNKIGEIIAYLRKRHTK